MATATRVVRQIPVNFIKSSAVGIVTKTKVAAYARVSTDKSEQEDSFERQVEHYTHYIKSRTDWEYVDIYADPGITGTRADKRPEFQRMMADCRLGKINKILCKSIARFARNTVDALESIRELKELGIGVYFESQNIDTLTPGGDVLLTILAAMAEQESRTISTNVKWTFQKKRANGEVTFNYTRFLGYTRNEQGEIEIVPEQAEIVRRIYREFMCGYSSAIIARRLMEDGIPTPSNKTEWRAGVVRSILRNEKYYGAAILGKTYKPDVLSKKRYKNEGQSDMYYVEDSHPAIISKEEYDMVQEELKRRGEVRGYSENNQGRFSSKYPFSKKIICGECGTHYRRHAQKVKGVYQATWVCATHKLKGNEGCTHKFLTEKLIEDAFIAVAVELLGDIKDIKETLTENIMTSLTDDTDEKLVVITEAITEAQNQMLTLVRDKRKGIVSDEEYAERGNTLATEIDRLTAEKTALESETNTARINKRRLDEILEFIEGINPTAEFDAEVFKTVVEEIIVRDESTLEFHFKVGIVKSITVDRT